MKKCTIKKRYLIQTPKEVVRSLLTTFPSYKKNLHQLYIENKPPLPEKFGVMAMRFLSTKEQDRFEENLASFILLDVSADKRYKNRYLALFGLPQNYDFSLKDVFIKCDKLNVNELELSLLNGMSTQKVLKVLLYSEMLCFERAVENLLEDEANAPKLVFKIAHNMISLLQCSHRIFDPTLLEALIQAINPFLCKNREKLLNVVQSVSYSTLLLDMHFFLREESGFYLLKKSEMPILFFVKKELNKADASLVQKLKKSIIVKGFAKAYMK